MQQEFHAIGSKLEPLDAAERLRVLYNFYRIGDEETFSFDFDAYVKSKTDYKNDICGSMIKYSPNDFETDRKICRAVFIRRYPTSLPDTFINEITNVPVHSITSIDIVPVPKDLTTRTLQKNIWVWSQIFYASSVSVIKTMTLQVTSVMERKWKRKPWKR